MTRKHIATAVVAGLAVLTGCTAPSTTPSTSAPSTASTLPGTPTSTPSAATSPSPTATPSSAPSGATAQAATEKVQEFLAVSDLIRSDVNVPIDRIYDVAWGYSGEKWRKILSEGRLAGQRQVGAQTATFLSQESGTSADQWLIGMCVDVSKVDIVNADGKSVVSPSRKNRSRIVYTVDRDPKSQQWHVTLDDQLEVC